MMRMGTGGVGEEARGRGGRARKLPFTELGAKGTIGNGMTRRPDGPDDPSPRGRGPGGPKGQDAGSGPRCALAGEGPEYETRGRCRALPGRSRGVAASLSPGASLINSKGLAWLRPGYGLATPPPRRSLGAAAGRSGAAMQLSGGCGGGSGGGLAGLHSALAVLVLPSLVPRGPLEPRRALVPPRRRAMLAAAGAASPQVISPRPSHAQPRCSRPSRAGTPPRGAGRRGMEGKGSGGGGGALHPSPRPRRSTVMIGAVKKKCRTARCARLSHWSQWRRCWRRAGTAWKPKTCWKGPECVAGRLEAGWKQAGLRQWRASRNRTYVRRHGLCGPPGLRGLLQGHTGDVADGRPTQCLFGAGAAARRRERAGPEGVSPTRRGGRKQMGAHPRRDEARL